MLWFISPGKSLAQSPVARIAPIAYAYLRDRKYMFDVCLEQALERRRIRREWGPRWLAARKFWWLVPTQKGEGR